MYSYQIKIILKSDTLVGLGEGYGAIIDSDIVIDEIGLPYIPSKRIKGIMLESAKELNRMLEFFDRQIDINKIFGDKGNNSGVLLLSNFYILEYKNTKEWLKYLTSKNGIVNKQNITKQFTSIRYSTSINCETEIAKEHSLRTERVIDKNNVFSADVEFPKKYENDIALICQNMHRMGTKRTRGFGEIEVALMKDGKNINDNAIKELERGNR